MDWACQLAERSDADCCWRCTHQDDAPSLADGCCCVVSSLGSFPVVQQQSSPVDLVLRGNVQCPGRQVDASPNHFSLRQ